VAAEIGDGCFDRARGVEHDFRDMEVCVAAPATSSSTVPMLCVAWAALATLDEMWLVAAFCSSIEAATPVA